MLLATGINTPMTTGPRLAEHGPAPPRGARSIEFREPRDTRWYRLYAKDGILILSCFYIHSIHYGHVTYLPWTYPPRSPLSSSPRSARAGLPRPPPPPPPSWRTPTCRRGGGVLNRARRGALGSAASAPLELLRRHELPVHPALQVGRRQVPACVNLRRAAWVAGVGGGAQLQRAGRRACMLCCFRQPMYSDLSSEHSRKWSSGKLPLSGGFGGRPLAGRDAKDAMSGGRWQDRLRLGGARLQGRCVMAISRETRARSSPTKEFWEYTPCWLTEESSLSLSHESAYGANSFSLSSR